VDRGRYLVFESCGLGLVRLVRSVRIAASGRGVVPVFIQKHS
jgi:hypothetical protein